MNKFRAILLSAGLGTRLRPITNKVPKCLVKIGKKRLLELWLDDLCEAGCEAVLINTHYMHKQVNEFLSTVYYPKMEIETVYEKNLLGTAGTLIKNIGFYNRKQGMLIHSDNFSTIKIKNIIDAHKNKDPKCILTMLTFNTDKPSQSGIIEKDSNNIMTGFFEKVTDPPGICANGALYVFDNNFMKWLLSEKADASDFSLDILPNLINKTQTFHTQTAFIDIGTPESLEKARLLVSKNGGLRNFG